MSQAIHIIDLHVIECIHINGKGLTLDKCVEIMVFLVCVNYQIRLRIKIYISSGLTSAEELFEMGSCMRLPFI